MIKGILPRRGVAVMYGESQSFKSFLALDMAVRVALGEPWGGRKVTKGTALYIAAEGGGGIEDRIDGLSKAHPHWPDAAQFGSMCYSPNLGAAPPRGDVMRLVEMIRDTGQEPSLIVVDTLSQTLHGADENNVGMTTFIQNAQVLSSAFGALVLAIHHKGWSKEDRPRGNSSLYAAADAQIFCQRLPDGYSASMTLQKMKDGPNNVRLTAYLESVPLYVDEDGDEVTTLVVERIEDGVAPRAERLAKRKPATLPAAAKTALDALNATIKAHGAEPEPCPDIPARTKVVPLDKWRERAYSAGISESDTDDSKRKAFKRAYDKLVETEKICVWNSLVWAA